MFPNKLSQDFFDLGLVCTRGSLKLNSGTMRLIIRVGGPAIPALRGASTRNRHEVMAEHEP